MRIQVSLMVFLALAWPASVLAEQAASKSSSNEVVWSYEGDTGPEHWGDLAPEFAKCKSGWSQSPIDIMQIYPVDLPPMQFNYNSAPLSIENDGQTIKVNFSGDSYITIGEERFRLTELHFHSPSENTIYEDPFDMAAHLVHSNDAGELAVVVVMFSDGGGGENAALKKIWKNMPTKAGERVEKNDKVNAADLLPEDHTYYHFMGSLTTPPCTEGVRWYVLEEAVSIGEGQLAAYRKLYHGNVRPTQKLNGRSVRSSRSSAVAPQ